jgi:hypothetical protein
MKTQSLAVVLFGLAACGGGQTPPGGDDDGAGPDAPIAEDTTVVGFDDEYVHFTVENRRVVDKAVTFPAPGQSWKKVTLHLGLACPPEGGCDWWDRLGRLSLVEGEGEAARELELARFVTPYRVGGEFTVDVTDLQRLLEGDKTLRVFIDTWVGPGHSNGAGWLVDASFEFEGGVASPEPFAVVPLWAPAGVVYGDPARPTVQSMAVDVPTGATGARVRALVTGHGQGNADNCAEFCPKEHTLSVGGESVDRMLWRDDCPTTAVPNQQGTWMYPRAGWCPGAMVEPWIADVAAPTTGQVEVAWDVEAFENTCRPDATTCSGCTLGTGCDYDGGAHTEPRWELSGVLVLLR